VFVCQLLEEVTDVLAARQIGNLDKNINQMQKELESRIVASSEPQPIQNLPVRSKIQLKTTIPGAPITSSNLETDESGFDSSITCLENHPSIVLPAQQLPQSLTDSIGSFSEAYANVSEINPIVATMDTDTYSSSSSEYESEDDDAEETENGYSHPLNGYSEDYVRQMEALIKKHSMSNAGGGFEPLANGSVSLVGSTVDTKPIAKSILSKMKLEEQDTLRKRKGVNFADVLDIAPEKPTQPEQDSAPAESIREPVVVPLADLVVERALSQSYSPLGVISKPKTLSQFRVKMHAEVEPVAIEPLSDEVSFKEELTLYKERMAGSEQRLDRNIFGVNHLNGFKDDEKPEASGGKISRFKAAKLGLRLE
jgi:hypothetical protein